MTSLIPLTNAPRDYAWGTVDGIADALGWSATGGPEAELWLGAHPLSPSRPVTPQPWGDLHEWEAQTGTALPYLLKVLAASSPLSLQAHPTPDQAAEGYAREEGSGIPLTARERNYKDPNAKPELIVAVDDGFEALCGFRPAGETVALIDALTAHADGDEREALGAWRVKAAGVRDAFAWLLSDDAAVAGAVAAASRIAQAHPRRFELIDRLAREYPGDPGILVAQMLNHVTLASGQSLWLPAGNIHAYLRGTGIELMGPSDNVLRGGLTPKHVDRDELAKVLDFTPGPASWLTPVEVGENVVAYRPSSLPSGEGVDFELLLITGDATVRTESAAIAVAVEGAFTLAVAGADAPAARGDIVFVDEPAEVRATGSGRLFIATGV
ncbi:mannose-6-phosphate isomerase, class I [Microbacterium sp.]|uniref:mannose-6-phosphate isomerase, class I n=1 Tax=Microbacterium sp. TaxID=51671 RepID=UPI003A921179